MSTEDAAITPDESRTPRLGLIGPGSMGAPMAGHLLDAYGHLVIHSRSPRPDLVSRGASWADSPCDLARQVDAVLVMLPDLPQFEPMLEGPDGLLAAEGPLLVMIGSTSSAIRVRELDATLRERTDDRVRVVDCPVSGGEDGAVAGRLSIMLGGPETDTDTAAVLLAPCGNPVRLGPLGAGQIAKSCNQMIVGATALALGEVTVMAERSGLDLKTLFDVLGTGYAGSNFLASRRQKFAEGDDSPSGKAEYMVKDLDFAADVARDTDTHGALLPALRATYGELVAAGLGDRDLATTRRFTAGREDPLTRP
jgi:3-hydroxyisobutyrate dehydrogenase-like beta-hydroxyacid dehydrogenase